MSDSVRFLCNNDASVPAGTGCNGFPFQYVPFTPPDDSHPVAVSFLDLIKWFWRVKLWSLSTDFQMTDSGGTTYSMTNGTIPQLAAMPTSELQLLIGSNLAATNQGLWDNPQTNDEMQLQLFQDLSGGRVLQSGTDLYPFINVVAIIEQGLSAQSFAQLISDSSFPFAVTATIDGTPFPLYVSLSAPPDAATYSVSHFDITPVEYWPYAAMVGGTPIYNTSTGSQIQSPTN